MLSGYGISFGDRVLVVCVFMFRFCFIIVYDMRRVIWIYRMFLLSGGLILGFVMMMCFVFGVEEM